MPAGYVLLRDGRVRAVVRTDLADRLASWLLAPRLLLPPGAEPIATGRGAAYRAVLPGGLRAVVRLSRRGGLVARLVRETYLGLQPRPIRELAVTVEARRRGVAAAEVLAARVEGRFVYRGALVTAEVAGATTLLDALRTTPAGAARRSLAARAGEAVAALHAAGVSHADLNLNNILVHASGGDPATLFVDFDRARVSMPPLGGAGRRRNLRRLARSLAKLDPGGVLAGPEDAHAFRAAYGQAAGEPCAC